MFGPFVAHVSGYDETQAALLLTYVGVLGVVNQSVVVGRLSRAFGPARLDRQGSTLGVTQGVGSLGRTLGPAAMAALYVLRVWSPFVCLVLLVLVFGGGAARGRAAPG